MGKPASTSTIDGAKRLVAALGLLALACGGTSHDSGQERAIWNSSSVAIDFTLTGPVGQRICAFSATREELSSAQIEGLSSLRLQDAAVQAGCDMPAYTITVHAGDGSSANYQATLPDCSSSPILLFDDFEAWARSTPCSLQSSQP